MKKMQKSKKISFLTNIETFENKTGGNSHNTPSSFNISGYAYSWKRNKKIIDKKVINTNKHV